MTAILPILRRSAMQTAQSCLHRYNEIWNKGTPDQSDLSLIGIGFHACAHRYILRLVDRQLPMDAEEAKLAFPEGIASALTPARLVPQVREIYMPWAERFGMDLTAFVAAEEHQIGKNQQTFTPDLVYARQSLLEIVDFKTYWHPLTETQIREDFQARFYAYNAMKIWPNFPVYRFTHAYVRFGSALSVDFTPGDLDSLADEVDAVAATIMEATERQEWPATAGVECAYCELKCPLADHPAIVPKRFTLPEQAGVVANWVLAADTQLKTAKKALKAYCAANGPITVGGVVFDHRPVVQRTYPIDAVMEAIHKVGADKDAATLAADNYSLTVSHSALGKIFKAYPNLEPILLGVQRSKTSYRFGPKKPGIGDEDDE